MKLKNILCGFSVLALTAAMGLAIHAETPPTVPMQIGNKLFTQTEAPTYFLTDETGSVTDVSASVDNWNVMCEFTEDGVLVTLKDAYIHSSGYGIACIGNTDLTIYGIDTEADGNNTLSAKYNIFYCSGGNLILTGTFGDLSSDTSSVLYTPAANIDIRGSVGDINSKNSQAISANNSVTISGSVDDITSSSIGIFANNSVNISGSVGNINNKNNQAIYANNSVNISGSVGDIDSICANNSVTISGSVGDINSDTHGIFANNSVNISDSGSVGDINSVGHGIYAYTENITISGSVGKINSKSDGICANNSVNISGSVGEIDSGNHGIYANNSVNISGSVGNINNKNNQAIYANNSVTISGSVGNITGGTFGIYAGGAIDITGSVGDITGGYFGIYAESANISISGSVGNITGGNFGINAKGTIDITGSVGDITGGTFGIYAATENISISGSVGNITGGNFGIQAVSADITITGFVGNITGGNFGINAKGTIDITGQVILLPENGKIAYYDEIHTVLDGNTPAKTVRFFPADITVTIPADPDTPVSREISASEVPNGQTVHVDIPEHEGYDPSVTVTDENGKPVKVTANDDGTYSFVMPETDVTITVEYTAIAEEEPDAQFFFPRTFLLSFEENGGSTIKSVPRAFGSANRLSEFLPTREGYTFTGWYADRALTRPIEKVVMTGPVTVYAGWEKIG